MNTRPGPPPRWSDFVDADPRAAAMVTVSDSGCWEWQRCRSPLGYGRMTRNYRNWMAHRWVYTMLIGPIREGLDLDHLCRNPPCVNPAHLNPATRRENLLAPGSTAFAAVNAARTHCPQGHEYTPENTLRVGEHGRGCRQCRIEQDRRRWTGRRKETSNATRSERKRQQKARARSTAMKDS